MYKNKGAKRRKDGVFENWLGVDYKGTKQVFRMPAELSQEAADRRWNQIVALWLQIESEVVASDAPHQSFDAPWSARWDEERLRAANRWNNLIARIRKDKGEEFTTYSFGKTRKTAATVFDAEKARADRGTG